MNKTCSLLSSPSSSCCSCTNLVTKRFQDWSRGGSDLKSNCSIAAVNFLEANNLNKTSGKQGAFDWHNCQLSNYSVGNQWPLLFLQAVIAAPCIDSRPYQIMETKVGGGALGWWQTGRLILLSSNASCLISNGFSAQLMHRPQGPFHRPDSCLEVLWCFSERELLDQGKA